MPNENDPSRNKTIIITPDNWTPWGRPNSPQLPQEVLKVAIS